MDSKRSPRGGKAGREKLTGKQQAFVREYLVDLNATQAAKRAGYRGSDETLRAVGHENLTKPHIAAAVAAVQAKRADKLDLDKEWVLRALKKNYTRAMQEEEVTDREGNGLGVFVYAGQVANRAAELIGKELGMFVERQEVTGKDGEPLKTELTLNLPTVDPAEVIAILRGAGVADRVAPVNENGNGQR